VKGQALPKDSSLELSMPSDIVINDHPVTLKATSLGKSHAIFHTCWIGAFSEPSYLAARELRSIIECNVCLNVYQQPVMLSCSHVFCRNCIAQIPQPEPGKNVKAPDAQ